MEDHIISQQYKTNIMKKQQIGKAVMYLQDGKIISAEFIPLLKIETDADVLKELNKLQEVTGTKEEEIKKGAELALASFFNKISEIELADREKYRIVSETVECGKNAKDEVTSCIFEFYFEEI